MNYGKRPLWQWVVIYLVVAVVAYGAIYYFVLSKNGGYTPTPSQTYTPPAQQTPQPTPPQQSQSSNPAQPPASAQNNIVTYTDSGFSPSKLTIKKGDTVIFKNTASDDMWVASNPHPTHTNYPGFDAKRKIAPGETYQFTFTKTGSWGYHNHLNPSEGGTVIVQ